MWSSSTRKRKAKLCSIKEDTDVSFRTAWQTSALQQVCAVGSYSKQMEQAAVRAHQELSNEELDRHLNVEDIETLYRSWGAPGTGATPDRQRAEVEWGSADCLRAALRLYTENQKEPKRHFCLWSHHELHPKKTWILQCIRSALQYTIMKARCTAVHIMQALFIPMLEHFK